METGQTQSETKHEGAWPEAVMAHGSKWQPSLMSGIALGILLLLATLGLARKRKVPGTLQGAFEFVYELLEDIVKQGMGPSGAAYFPLFLCFFLFILFNNLLGLFPYMASGTAKTDTTLALALVTFSSTHILGIKKKGLAYIGHFFHILDASKEQGFSKVLTFLLQWFLLPAIEIVGELARPLSLTMRLFGNIYAKEMLLTILAALVLSYYRAEGLGSKVLMLMPLALRPGVLILGVLVSLIQAVVFTALSMIYIGGAIAHHEAHDEHA